MMKQIEQEDKVMKVKEKKHLIQIVNKLPVQEVRTIERDDAIVTLYTVEEYLTLKANNEEVE